MRYLSLTFSQHLLLLLISLHPFIKVWGPNSTSTPYKKQPVMAGIRYQPCPAWPEPDCHQLITSSLIFSECSKQNLLWAEMLDSYLSLLQKNHNITAELGFYFLLHTKSELKTWVRLTQPQLSQGQAREGDWPAAASQTPDPACQGNTGFGLALSARPEIETGAWRVALNIIAQNSKYFHSICSCY